MAETLPDNSTDTYVAELRQGEVFGELGVLKERTRSVTVVALERTACLMIPDVDFLDALRTSPETLSVWFESWHDDLLRRIVP